MAETKKKENAKQHLPEMSDKKFEEDGVESMTDEREKKKDLAAAKEVDKDLDNEDEEMPENLEDEESEREDALDEKEAKREETREERDSRERLESWVPKTQLGKDVLAGKIKSIEEIREQGLKILEPEIVDKLLDIKIDLVFMGQAKGKFGGGKRRAWKQTQKKKKEGNVPKFSVIAVVGNKDGYVGIGFGKASETLPAKDKAIRKAKLNLQKVPRSCASFDCTCNEKHSIPFAVEGKCSSVSLKLMPAPQGSGLVAGDELKKILRLAGIQDIYSQSQGKTRTTANTVKACMDALAKLGEFKN